MPFKTFSDLSAFVARRKKLNELAPNSVFIISSGHEGHLENFLPNSNFLYLTGFEEPEATAVITTGAKVELHLFVRDKDPSIEIWDGFRFGPELTQKEFLADKAYSNTQLEDVLPELMKGRERIYYAVGHDADEDQLILGCRDHAQQLVRRTGQGKAPLFDPNDILAQLRVIKDDLEVECMKEVCEISARAHIEVMKKVRAGRNERQSQGDFLQAIYEECCQREAYSSIVASSDNACVLHYRANNRQMNEGEFLLIDAGGKKNYYNADITRTYPVGGKFSEPQRKLYQAVLDVQNELIDLVTTSFSLSQMQDKSCELLTEKLVELGILKGSVQDNLKSLSFRKYYPHGVGHYLGLDVHDVGFSKVADKPVAFQPNMIVTVEPGLYIPSDDESAPQEYRGLGVRIEDDVLVTTGKPVVLTSLVPKEVSDIESLMA